jgi:DNA-binding response OmpR family regulator
MKKRILIIDNEPRWIDFVKDDLSRFEIVIAHDANNALKELENGKFDLVIASSRHLDVLESIAKKYDKRFIVATINPNTQEALHAYRLGAARYISKSFGKQDLFNRVREVIPLSNNL